MTAETLKCLRCQVTMEAGYIQDIGYSIVVQTKWNRGAPEQRKLFGMKNGIKYREDGITMTAYRCPKCGAVELNAPPQ